MKMMPIYSYFYYLCTKINFIIATKKLYIEQFTTYFKGKVTFETLDIVAFYLNIETQIKPATINWRIYKLVQNGVIKRIGRGKFTLGAGRIYIPLISPKLKSINSKLKKDFPYLKVCIWHSSAFNEFMIHQPGRFYIFVEVEKEATQSVFFYLKENKYAVFVEPSLEVITNYIPDQKETLIVKSLVTEAPLQMVNGINTPAIEKMLVDVFCDNLLFAAQQGSEMRIIFNEAMSKYDVNINRMLRYASRRRKKKELTEYINPFAILRQQKPITVNL